MSTDGYLYGTRRWPPFVDFLRLYPFQKLVFEEAPELPFSFAQRVRGNLTETCPTNERSAVLHTKNSRSFTSIE
jgi:hypothetical protein